MVLTVRDLLRTPGLDLDLMAGGRGLTATIRWVHVSELEDPTPWLKGGEVLLTTGIGVGRSPAQQRRYVERLVDAGLAGLGFGLGFSHRRVPKALLDEADRAGFPVFSVPYAMPFIAITEAVFTRLAAEQYDLLSRSLDAEHTLTRVVLEGEGVTGIVSSLARGTGGWAILLDLRGAPLAVAPTAARGHVARVWSEVQSGGDGLRFSLSVVDGRQHIAIQPVSSQGRVEAFLAVGKGDALTQFDRIVSSHALALLALELSKARAVSEAERRLKGDLLDQLVSGTISGRDAARALRRFGFDVNSSFAVAALAGEDRPEDLAQICGEVLAGSTRAYLTSPREDLVLAVSQPDAHRFVSTIRAAVAERSSGTVLGGGATAPGVDALPRAFREARYALQVCRTEGRPEADVADLGTYQLLLSLQEPEALQTFADSVLGPLDRYDSRHGGDLVRSVRAFLERNARWEHAAADLFVHRHTLRYRMRKVEQLTGRDLSSARDRMELFLAVRARDMLTTAEWIPPGGRPTTAGQGDSSGRRRGERPVQSRRLS
ncbi:MAG: PucR family transcriptional regulator [Actinomycetota bacterium]